MYLFSKSQCSFRTNFLFPEIRVQKFWPKNNSYDPVSLSMSYNSYYTVTAPSPDFRSCVFEQLQNVVIAT